MGASFSQNYHEWLAVADAALPRNIIGYSVQLSLTPFRADPFTVLPYDNPKEIAKCGPDVGKRSFLPIKLPEREGPRPEILKFVAPNRQVDQFTGDDMHKLLAQAIDELVAKHSAHVVVKTSKLEKVSGALFIADSIATPHSIAKKMQREIAHVHAGPHGGDYSMHMCLSPTDCKEVITKQWGERMTLAGSFVPQEYLIVYTPRTKEEVEVVKGIVEAAIWFMNGGLEFIDPTTT